MGVLIILLGAKLLKEMKREMEMSDEEFWAYYHKEMMESPLYRWIYNRRKGKAKKAR